MEIVARVMDRTALPTTAPFLICTAMIISAATTHAMGGPSGLSLLADYIVGTISVVVTAILLFVFVEVARLASLKAEHPLPIVFAKLRSRLALLVLPLLVFPTFLASFTAAKSGMQGLIGFRFDLAFAKADAIIFGTDPWRLTHALLGPWSTSIIEFFYVQVWVTALVYSKALIPLFADRRVVWTYFTAMLLTWFLGGFVAAYLLSAAGPTFANLADPETAARFLPLKQQLIGTLPPDSSFLRGPAYLQEANSSGSTYYGGGISAMPSMHIAAVSLYVLAARGTRWHLPACAFAVIIFIGSIHSGYHYAVDGFAAAAIAYGCWRASERLYASQSCKFVERNPASLIP
jgi:hypothetical protein